MPALVLHAVRPRIRQLDEVRRVQRAEPAARVLQALMPKEQARRDAPIAMDADVGEPGSAVLTLGRTRLTHTVADLDAWPAIDTMPARDPKDPQHEALPGLPRALRQHHARAQKQGWRGSAKLSAVAGEIRRLKDADVTTQFVVVSQYGDLLDELQEAFDPVKYEVDLDLANRRQEAAGREPRRV